MQLKALGVLAAVAGLTASGCSPIGHACASVGVALPLVHVVNVDVPLVDVAAWQSMSPVTVSSGTERTIFPTNSNPAPSPPWHLTIREAPSETPTREGSNARGSRGPGHRPHIWD